MSDALRTEGIRARDGASAQDRDAKIEQLLLVGLDHYFAARYELAINVWTRALFLDRSHARARAYIERARSALAERQRESEELLQKGIAAFQRGDGDAARRMLQAAIEAGAPPDEALAVLERLNRLETAASPSAAAAGGRAHAPRAPLAPAGSAPSVRRAFLFALAVSAAVSLGGFAAWNTRVDWRSLGALALSAARADAPAATTSAPVARETPLAPPRRDEEIMARAKTLAAGGHLHEALSSLETVRSTDPQKPEADRLRADIQRQLLALTAGAAAAPAGPGKGDRRNP
jgi:tetratricopeptide (TPR) repeat protein